ncbi:Uncharacterized protein Fot_21947 [Forsythia ovata]|uniref:Uncharacterized protein n=1 Tax=Forsythia ovata TaxID=205694 RepID=A0ABD1UWB0_9LAMI
MKNGILTSNSAGNSGPDPESITNFSPRSLSVAASVIDRKFLGQVQLENNETYELPIVQTKASPFNKCPIVGGRLYSNELSKLSSTLESVPEELDCYPGHIAKAEKELKNQLKLMDAVIEVRGARIPMSTSHPQAPKAVRSLNQTKMATEQYLSKAAEKSNNHPKIVEFDVVFIGIYSKSFEHFVVLNLALTSENPSKLN